MDSLIGVDNSYWLRRSDMMYYKYVDILVKAFAYDAKNIIDIGSANTQYIESYYWIPDKYTLDIKNPYKSPHVTAIEEDFLNYHIDKKFDFVTCFQVLEHIPDAKRFAEKLFEVSDKVLLSIPYMWPEDAEKEHINDPVDSEKLKSWTGREPSYSIIVSEPLRIPSKGIEKRLIAYYGPETVKINYKKALENVENLKLASEEIGRNRELESISKNNQIYVDVRNDLTKVIENQKNYYELIKLELEIFNLENESKHRVGTNKEIGEKVFELRKEINHYKNQMPIIIKEKQVYQKEYNKILNSTSWKSTAPMRKAGKTLKNIIGKK